MKKVVFFVFAFIVFASVNFAQKPAATPAKKSAAPIKKESAPIKKSPTAAAKKEAAPTIKKTAADTSKKISVTVKKDSAPTKKDTAKKEFVKKDIAKKEKETAKKEIVKKEVKKESAKKETIPSIKRANHAPIKNELPTKKPAPSAEKLASPAEKIAPVKAAALTKFSAADWKILTDAVQSEKWTKADALAADYLKKLSVENDEKQLAQLRYIRLYALAGEIVALHEAKSTVEENAAWTLLDKTISEFNGKELILPPHQFLADCRENVNFVCPVKTDDHALRVTATNKEGTAIHSFNYVSFDDKIAFDNFDGGKIFLGGKLRRAEFNQDLSKPWLMRLFFDDGFITRADVN